MACGCQKRTEAQLLREQRREERRAALNKAVQDQKKETANATVSASKNR